MLALGLERIEEVESSGCGGKWEFNKLWRFSEDQLLQNQKRGLFASVAPDFFIKGGPREAFSSPHLTIFLQQPRRVILWKLHPRFVGRKANNGR